MPADDRPDDLVTVREAARLADRGLSTVRGWLRAGELRAWRGEPPAHGGSAPVFVSRAELLLRCAAGARPSPGRRPPAHGRAAEAAAGLAAARAELAQLRAERDGARELVEAVRATAAALEARARDLALALEGERARARGLEAELEALRAERALPWWRRLLGAPRGVLTAGNDPDA